MIREQIADWIPALTEEYRLEVANEILSLITQEIEKVENPFGDEYVDYHRGFMRCRQSILKLLEE